MPARRGGGQKRAHSIKQQQPGSERFAHQFNGDFSGIGISLDVDEDGRLVVQHVDENGEAAKKCPELGKGDLHIVSVGIVNKNEKVEADELLRQLMTLPRPVRVEFARTTDTASPGAEEKARAGTEKARVGAKQPVKKRQQPGKKSSPSDTGSDQPKKPPARKPRGGANVTEGTNLEEGATLQEGATLEEELTLPGGGKPDDRDERQPGKETPEIPPQWEKALTEGTGLEEGRKGGEKGEGAATAASEASSGVNANPVREGVQLSEACAGSEGAPNAGGFDEDSGQDKLSQDGSESTTRSAALTDGMESIQRWLQDDSDNSEDEKRMSHRHSWYTTNRQRGGHAPDILPASPLARAEALAKARAALNSGKDPVAPTPSTAAPGDDEVRLPNAVSARCHRSPSWSSKEPPEKRDDAVVAGTSHAAATGGGVGGDTGQSQSAVGRNEATSKEDPSRRSTIERKNSAQARSKSSKAGSRGPEGTPRMGAVSARLHRSPSYILRETSAQGGEGAKAGTPTEHTTLVVRGSPAINTAGKEASANRIPASSGKNGAAAVLASVRAPSSAEKNKFGAPSSSIGGAKPGKPTGKKITIGESIVPPSQGRATKLVKKGDASKNESDVAVGRNNAAHVDREKTVPACADKASHDPARNDGDSAKNGESCSAEGSTACSVTNHKPFTDRPENSLSLSEGMVGLAPRPPAEDSSLSPAEPQPPSPDERSSAEPPALGYGGRRPSVGPANPRAMYGHVPPPPGEQPKIARRPSSIMMPPPSLQSSGPGGGDAGAERSAKGRTKASRESGAEEEGGSPGTSGISSLGLSPRRTQYNFTVEKVQLNKIDETGPGSTGQHSSSLEETVKLNPQRGNAGATGRVANANDAGDTAMDSQTTRREKPGLSLDDLLARRQERLAADKNRPSFGGNDIEDGVRGASDEPKSVSWEKHLHAMAGVGPGPNVPVPSRGGVARPKDGSDHSTEKKNEALGVEGSSALHEISSTASTAGTPPATAWKPPQFDVGRTPSWNAGQQQAGSRMWGETGSGGQGDGREGQVGGGGDRGSEVIEESAGTSDSGPRGRSNDSRRPQDDGSKGGVGRPRARSSSRAVRSSAPAAAISAASKAAAAASASWQRGRTTSKRTAIAAETARTSSAIQGGGDGGVSGGGERYRRSVRSVARVRVGVRSSVYLVVAELDKSGFLLLEQVMEAEKLRHGTKAVAMVGLMNESTGNTVDMDAPVERSISSGDSLTAIVVPTANGSSHGGHRSSEGFMSTASEADSEGVGGGTGWSGQRRRQESCDPPSPMRSRGSGGSDGYCSPFRSISEVDNIDQLRDQVARQFFKERRAAGEGVGALSPPSRPPGSLPLTPVTSGGRGASPERPEVTSPRSASPKGAVKGPGKLSSTGLSERMSGSSPPSPTRSAHSATSGHTHYSGFSLRSYGRTPRSEAAFLAQSTLTTEELDQILKEELLKSRKWSTRSRGVQDKIRRVWEERGADYERLQREFEANEAAQQDKARQRREMEAAQMEAKSRQRTARAQSALEQARSSRGNRDSRAKEAQATHRRRMQQINHKRDQEHQQQATKAQIMDRRREDVRDSFLDMVDAENEAAIQTLETPLEMLNRALREGDNVLEKKARRAILRQSARERVHVRERAARVLAEKRRVEQTPISSVRSREEKESSMMPGPGQYNLRDFSEYGPGACARSLL